MPSLKMRTTSWILFSRVLLALLVCVVAFPLPSIILLTPSGIDAALVFATVILLKDRKEKIRYRHIDEKNGAGSF